MELRDVYEIWDRFDNSDVAEFELELSGMHVKLRRPEAGAVCTMPVSQATAASAFPAANAAVQMKQTESGAATATAANSNEVSTQKDNNDSENAGTPIKAPLVGTFYKAPTPQDAPFVTVGQKVKKGDVIGIIEAMKLMNEVVAPCDGEVSEILAEDGKLVQFNQVLVVLK
ncbi:MAG: acetyl-CoA carboxylase biotin carboxyl carrier protein [Lachnospira sp.]